MRSNFLTALANPAVPLSGSKLGNVNVPHGIKGEGMLEIGWERGVAVARMGWLIGVVGGLEVVSLDAICRVRNEIKLKSGTPPFHIVRTSL